MSSPTGTSSGIAPIRGAAQLAEEGKGDVEGLHLSDWESRKYSPPNKERAIRRYRRSLFAQGRKKCWQVTVEDFSEAGLGLALYFRLVLYLAVFFFIASAVSIPILTLVYSGTRFAGDELDGLGLALFTIGNLGNANATLSGNSTLTGTSSGMVSVPLFGWNYTIAQASSIITLIDLVYSLLFLAFGIWWYWKVNSLDRELTDGDVNMSDYTVHVMGLPKHATAASVRAHFDTLYNLRQPDWTYASSCCGECYCNRKITTRRQYKGPKLAARLYEDWARARANRPRRAGGCCSSASAQDLLDDARAPVSWQDWAVNPVLNAANTGDQSYLKSWVAEVSLITPNGTLLKRYKALQTLRNRQLHARAAIKVYLAKNWTPDSSGGLCRGAVECHSDTSCAAGPCQVLFWRTGPKDARLVAARARLAAIERRIDTLDLAHAQRMTSDAIGAFVVFNNEESWRRCIYDYQVSQRWYFPIVAACGCSKPCQAPPLLFDGSAPLSVRKAPEPADVVWENLETGACERAARITLTNLCMLLFLAASLGGIVLARRAQDSFKGTLPAAGICSALAPSIVLGRTDLTGTDMFQLRGNSEQNAACQSQFGDDSTFLWWDGLGAPPLPTAPYPEAPVVNITNSAGVTLETVENLCAVPCIPSDVTSNRPCVVPTVEGEAGGASTTFPVKSLIGCYCIQHLRSLLSNKDLSWGEFQDAVASEPLCTELASTFVLSQVLIFVAAGGVVLINTSLRSVLVRVTKLELHSSVAAFKSAVAVKLFLALFLNTGLIVLLLNARIPGASEASLGVLSGQFSSFEPSWYTSAGAAVMITMMINVLSPHILPVTKYCCAKPCRRRCCSKTAILQSEMDKLYSAPEFELGARVPHVMNTVTVTLLYSSGMPLLLPLAAVALLTTYIMDVFFVTTVYAKPPPMDASMARLSYRIMPFALLVHCAFAVWFYGDEDSVASTPILLGDPGGVGAEQRYRDFVSSWSEGDTIGIVPKVLRQNTFPMFFLFVVVAGTLFFLLVVRRFAALLVARALYVISCGSCCTGIREVNAKLNPPLTHTYEHRLPLRHGYKITPEKDAEGYCLIKDQPRHKDAVSRVRKYLSDVPLDKRCSRDRLLMLTWEVVKARTGLASYAMTANPKYTQAVLALEAGASKSMLRRATKALTTVASVFQGAHPQEHRLREGRAAAYSLGGSGGAAKDSAKTGGLQPLTLDDSVPGGAGGGSSAPSSNARNPGTGLISPSGVKTPATAAGALTLAFAIDDSVSALEESMRGHDAKAVAAAHHAQTMSDADVAHADDQAGR